MLEKRQVLLVSMFVVLLFAFSFVNAYSYTVTEVNSTLATVSVVGAVDLYSYEINFLCDDASASAVFNTFLGGGATTSNGIDFNATTNIISVYESRLDNTDAGVSGDGVIFNLTHACDLTTRQSISILANETEETTNICTETATCGAWSSCTAEVQSRTCSYPTCLFDDYLETRACGVETVTVNTGGGGGGTTSTVTSLKITFSAPEIKDNGEVIIPVVLHNDGTLSFSEIKLVAYLMKNGVKLGDIPVIIDKEKIAILGAGGKENVTLSTKIVESDISFYEVVLEVESVSPSYKTSNRAMFTFVGKKAANVLKVVAFTEGIIDEHPECLELRDMIEDAQADFKAGNTEQAIAKANAAVEACKSYLENPLRPIYSKQAKDNILLYLGIGIVAAILFGIIFNVYRYYKFK
jgi:hypothetical protein